MPMSASRSLVRWRTCSRVERPNPGATVGGKRIKGELLTPGPQGAGSRRRAVVKGLFGGTMECVMEVTEFEPNRMLALRLISASWGGSGRTKYVKALLVGAPPETAAIKAGFSPATLYRWLRGASPEQRAFREAHEQALAEVESRLALTPFKASLTQPRWALEILTRR